MQCVNNDSAIAKLKSHCHIYNTGRRMCCLACHLAVCWCWNRTANLTCVLRVTIRKKEEEMHQTHSNDNSGKEIRQTFASTARPLGLFRDTLETFRFRIKRWTWDDRAEDFTSFRFLIRTSRCVKQLRTFGGRSCNHWVSKSFGTDRLQAC